MSLGKLFVAAVAIVSLVTPAVASAAVRPSAKPIAASAVKQDRSLVLRSSARAGNDMQGENGVFLAGLPLLLIAAAVVAVAAAVAVVVDEGSSPG